MANMRLSTIKVEIQIPVGSVIGQLRIVTIVKKACFFLICVFSDKTCYTSQREIWRDISRAEGE